MQPLTPALARQLDIRDANVRGLVVGSVHPNSDAAPGQHAPAYVGVELIRSGTSARR